MWTFTCRPRQVFLVSVISILHSESWLLTFGHAPLNSWRTQSSDDLMWFLLTGFVYHSIQSSQNISSKNGRTLPSRITWHRNSRLLCRNRTDWPRGKTAPKVDHVNVCLIYKYSGNLWKGQESLTKVAKFGPFPLTILYKSCLFYPSWQATSLKGHHFGWPL